MIARILHFLDRAFPFPASEAGVPGLSANASALAKRGAQMRADARKYAIRMKCAELREGPVSRIAPRDEIVAPVRALREVRA